jgi:hypothetical protein
MKKNDVLKTVANVVVEVAKDTLVYASVGMAVLGVCKELNKAKDYFDKK